MDERTSTLWALQERHPMDRERLFRAVATVIQARTVLYPGSFVDVSASFVFDDVTYVDKDRRAGQFFADDRGVRSLISSRRGPDAGEASWRFVEADYTEHLASVDGPHDLLLSLYAGHVSLHCTRYLRVGGWLLANPSHGDVAVAAVDPRYELVGAVVSRDGDYRVRSDGLEGYLVPKSPEKAPTTVEEAAVLQRGIAYTRSAFAYLFLRTS